MTEYLLHDVTLATLTLSQRFESGVQVGEEWLTPEERDQVEWLAAQLINGDYFNSKEFADLENVWDRDLYEIVSTQIPDPSRDRDVA